MSRIPVKAPKDYPLHLRFMYWIQRKRYGYTLTPTQIWGRQPVLLRRFLGFFKALERKNSPLPPSLRALLTVRVSQINDCNFCVDFNSRRVLDSGGDRAKIDALEAFEEADCFTPAEKAALAYAEAVTHSDRTTDDALFDRLSHHFDDDTIVELTAQIAFQNLSSKFNAALDLPAQGLCQPGQRTDRCQVENHLTGSKPATS